MTSALLEHPVAEGPLDEDGTRLRWRAVGAEIRAARQDRGLSQSELAVRVGIKQNVLSEDERGKERGIPIHRLMAYADALEMNYDLLVQMAYGRTSQPAPGETYRSA